MHKVLARIVTMIVPMFLSMFVTAAAWAQGAPASVPAQPQPSPMSMLVPFAAMFGVIYFLMIRPQQKKMRDQQTMLGALKEGDEVVTTSGILGKVRGMTDKIVTVEVDSGVKIKMLKSQVAQVVKGEVKDLAQ